MEIEELLNSESIWPHQVSAIRTARRYIEKFLTIKEEKPSALLRLPTGTGKSGIMTILSRCYSDTKNVLILTPSKLIRKQLSQDVEYAFFETIGLDNDLYEKDVREFLPSHTIAEEDNQEAILESVEPESFEKGDKAVLFNNSHPKVLVSTIQALNWLRNNDLEAYNMLARHIDLVMFDEGHREPAPEWAVSVRRLNKPTILLTATPYRNDHKQFNVLPNYTFKFTHKEAVAENYIRNVKFIDFEYQGVEDFINRLMRVYRKEIIPRKPSYVEKPRVIIKCADDNSIKEIVSHLKNRGESAIGIHHNFSKKSEGLFKNAPDLRKIKKENKIDEQPIFWVHQHKLTEGLDELSFCVLAIYDSFGNARQLIQQIGRIIRNKYPKKDKPALVLSSPWSRERGFWRGYLNYEDKYEDNLDLNFQREIFDSIHAVLPPHIYEDKTFRTKFEPLESNIYKSYKFRFSCNIYIDNDNFSLERLSKEIKSEWLKDDLDIRQDSPDWPKDNVFIMTYLKYSNDQLLTDRYLFGYKVGFLLCAKIEDYLFLYSSEGRNSTFVKENYRTPHPEDLKKFFAGESTEIKNVTLRSTDIGNHIVRRQNLTALSLSDTAHELVDYINFFSTAVAKPANLPYQRYVGFTRSRISDQTTVLGGFDDYYKWLEELIDTIKSKASDLKIPQYFNRFAKFANEPEETEPVNIVLDLEEHVSFFQHRKTKQTLNLDERCHDIKKGVFSLDANGQKYKIGISYDYVKKKYILEKKGVSDITQDFVYLGTDTTVKSENVLRYLNREQRFRIIPKTEGVIFAHKQFYEPRLSLTKVTQGDQLSLFDIFFEVPKLAEIASEKGKITLKNGESWDPDSLFGFIDNEGVVNGKASAFTNELGNGAELMICDDAGDNETCDFIIANPLTKKVILVHAKAYSKGKKRSASAFQEVFGQAIKNLSYLVPTELNTPPNLHLWDNGWSAYVGKDEDDNSVTLEINRRIRRGDGKANEIFAEIRQLIRNPTTSREVWIVLGNAFSLAAFKDEHSAKKPETIQIAYMLQSTWSNINKVASQFKIFCSP